MRIAWLLLCCLAAGPVGAQTDANRLTYLDSFCDPYYPTRAFPKLTTPQWVGEPGVEAVITLGIDDMRDPAKYEAFLRPLLDRLKLIDGRAPVSIMTCSIDPNDPQLQRWLAEGLSLECHTVDHPCPCLQGGDFDKAKSTYDRCVDLMHAIPGNRPVAFRFPCMDSKNTPSPRAFAEIVNRTTGGGKFLQISTSVTCLFTPADASLPRELVVHDGQERFRRYIPFPSFVNRVDNYPYPFVIGGKCWEFPCTIPDDWQGSNLQRPNNPRTLADLKAAVDATVLKRGVANIIFHPHGWITAEQLIELVDHVENKYGAAVKFLTFRECFARLNEHLLAGQPLRAADGSANGVRLLDLDADGYLDVCIGNAQQRVTRLWSPREQRWNEASFPALLVETSDDGAWADSGARFGVVRDGGLASLLVSNEQRRAAWTFRGGQWIEDPELVEGLPASGGPPLAAMGGRDAGLRLRDLDADGRCELLVGGPDQHGAWAWRPQQRQWRRLPFRLPEGAAFVDRQGRDAGLRLVDLNGDGRDDVVFSDETRSSVSVFQSLEEGWRTLVRGNDAATIPPISRRGTNNGAWFAADHLWLQNEDTASLPDGVDRRSFQQLLR